MANLSKKLEVLFRQYLIRKEKEKSVPVTYSYGGSYRYNSWMNEDTEKYEGVIYFYEWSDTKRTPKTYYTLKAFENFLNDCHIYLASWQREVLSHMKHPYVACKKGERDVIIKKSYEMLKNELTIPSPQPTPVSPSTFRGSEEREPYSVAITRPTIQRPPMVFEPEGRYPDYMDCCGRGHMQGEFWDW